MENHSDDNRFKNLKLLIGLRTKRSFPIECNDAFVVAQSEHDNTMYSSIFIDGAQIKNTIKSMQDLAVQIDHLLNRDWVWMGATDLYVTCHGMGLPTLPFWE